MARLVQNFSGTRGLLVAWSFLALGISLNQGSFSIAAIILVLAGFVLAAAVVAGGQTLSIPTRRDLAGPVAMSAIAAVAQPSRHLMHVHGADLVVIDVLAATTAVAMLLTLGDGARRNRWGWPLVALLAAVTGIVTVQWVNNPNIDVWYLLQQSSTGLLHGKDMYKQRWTGHPSGLQDVYPYLPGTTLMLAPFRLVLGDVRYGLVASLLVASYLIRRINPVAPVALAALILIQPHWAFLVDQSWTEPLLIAMLAGAVLAMKAERPVIAMLCLAAALASKQHIVLLLPLFAFWPGFGFKRAVQSCLLAFLVVIPWVIAGPHAFWHDAVKANTSLGVEQRALCLPSLFSRWGFTVGFWFLLLVLVATYALIFLRVARTPAGLAIGSSLVMWALDIANKQSFFNHYTLALGLLVIGVAAVDRTTRPVTPTQRPEPVTAETVPA